MWNIPRIQLFSETIKIELKLVSSWGNSLGLSCSSHSTDAAQIQHYKPVWAATADNRLYISKKKTTFKTLQETGLTAHAQIASIEAIWADMNTGLSWELHCTFGALGSNVWKPRFETLILRTRRRPTDWYWLTGEMLGSYSLSEILYWFVGVENVLERRLRNFLTNFSCLLLNPEG